MARKLIAALAVALLAALGKPALAGEEMTHMVVRLEVPNIDPGAFELKPLEYWRIGFRYLRLQEQPDPEQGIHGLIVANAPDSWMINLYTNEARHMVDRGETTNVHAPALPPHAGPSPLTDLEIGREVEFFQRHNAKPAGSALIDDVPTKATTLTFGGTVLTLHVRENGAPFKLSVGMGEESFAYRYDLYETGLALDLTLFTPPEGVRIIEAE